MRPKWNDGWILAARRPIHKDERILEVECASLIRQILTIIPPLFPLTLAQARVQSRVRKKLDSVAFYTYIVTNRRKGTLYTGHTDDIGARLEQHKFKIFKGFSAKYGCDKLAWFEEHETRDQAFRRERQIKLWKRAWKIELIESVNPDWLDISTCPCWPLPEGEIFDDLREKAHQTARIPL